ncbi:MAG: hypothetical protein FWH43_03735 [Endomicrobia bacterium]|nr:hypothetical protein [Endomicrobiia bacterium]
MARVKIIYHVLLRKSHAAKIAAVVVFAMFMNMLNFGVFMSFGDIKPDGSALKFENELGRICSAVNLPIKIVSDMYKKCKEVTRNNKDKSNNADNRLFALMIPVKQAKKQGSILRPEAVAPFSGGKFVFKSEIFSLFADPPPKYGSMFNYLAGIDMVRFMLLLLMLMLLLPRGIPVKIKNFINNNFACPVFMFNKAGIFILLRNAKGDSNENN